MTTPAAETIGAAALGAGVIASHINVNISVPYVGVPLNVVFAALLGVIAGLAWNDKDKTRKQLAAIAFGSVLAACSMVAVGSFAIDHFYSTKLDPSVMAPVALLVALFGPAWIPAIKERIGPWLDNLPFIGKKGA